MRYFIFITLLLLTFSVRAEEDSTAYFKQIFEQANEAYKSEKFREAASLYRQISDNGYSSYELYFNLGNAYYKSNNIPLAILYYEKAKKINPSDEDVYFNLELANSKIVDKVEPLPDFFLTRIGSKFIQAKSADGWALMGIQTLILTLVLLGLYIISKNYTYRKTGFYGSLVCLVFTVLFITFAASQKAAVTNDNYAIVFSPSVTAVSSPNEKSTQLFVIHEGLKVEIEETENNWSKIKLGNGKEGWVKTDALRVI